MTKLAQLLSNIFQPLLFPTYSMLLLFQAGNFVYFEFWYKLYTTLSVFILTAILPLVIIFTLKRMGIVTSVQLINRKERTIPYAFTIISFIVAAIFLYKIYMPIYIVAIMGGIIVSTLIIMLVNFKWKISAHLSAFGGFCAAIMVVSANLLINPTLLLATAFFLSGVLATSRIILKAHTLMQTVSGFLVGFGVVFFSAQLI